MIDMSYSFGLSFFIGLLSLFKKLLQIAKFHRTTNPSLQRARKFPFDWWACAQVLCDSCAVPATRAAVRWGCLHRALKTCTALKARPILLCNMLGLILFYTQLIHLVIVIDQCLLIQILWYLSHQWHRRIHSFKYRCFLFVFKENNEQYTLSKSSASTNSTLRRESNVEKT